MKKLLLPITLLFSLLPVWSQTATPPTQGDGSSTAPYQIETLDNLYWLSQTSSVWDKGNYFIQTADIDASGTKTWDNGKGFLPIGSKTTKYTGHYDAKGYAIKSLYINRTSSAYVGLFGYTSSADIDNLGLTNANINGLNYVGGLAGCNESSTIDYCYTTGNVSGTKYYVGGLVGHNYASTINYCYSACSVSGYNSTGGLVGLHQGSNPISYCYATGSVAGNTNVGGLAGDCGYAKINSCYATGSVSASSNVGSLVGESSGATISNCYWNNQTSGQSSSVGTGLTTEQMKQSANFTGLGSFDTIWGIRENQTYPALRGISNNAPFAFYDNLEMKGRTLLHPLLNNDYDYETQQDNLVFKLTDLEFMKNEEHLTDYKTYFCLGTFVAEGDSRVAGYYVGEVLAPGDTLWGNKAKIVLKQVANAYPNPVEDTVQVLEDDSLRVPASLLMLNDSDPDNDILSYVGAMPSFCGTAGTVLPSINDTVRYITKANWNGVDEMMVCISDGRLERCAKLYINVIPVNDAPVLSSVAADKTTNEDAPITLSINDVTATDIENNDLQLIIKKGSNYTFNDLTLTPALNYNGTLSVQVAVSDGMDESNVMTMNVVVTPINDVPTITSAAPATATEDVEYTYVITAADADSDALTYSLSQQPDGMTITGNTITWTPAEGILTSGEVTLTVSDGSLSATQRITITVNPVNDAPVITSTAPTTVNEGVEYTYTVTATDAEGSTLTYSIGNAPEGMTVVDNVITWTPSPGTATSGEVTLTVSDGSLTDSETFTVAVNNAPIITSTASTTATEGVEYTYTVSVTDANGDALFYSLTNAPTGMSISSNGVITWTPAVGTVTSGVVTLTVSDGKLTDNQEFTINVSTIPITFTITASAGSGGSISPSGSIQITKNADQAFIITANTGYHIFDVLVDGLSVGAVDGYTFSSVTDNHTIAANFENTTSIETTDLLDVSIYPNPCTNGFTINAKEEDTTLYIYDLYGNLIFMQKIIGKSFINVESLRTGVYILKANEKRIKLVKE